MDLHKIDRGKRWEISRERSLRERHASISRMEYIKNPSFVRKYHFFFLFFSFSTKHFREKGNSEIINVEIITV